MINAIFFILNFFDGAMPIATGRPYTNDYADNKIPITWQFSCGIKMNHSLSKEYIFFNYFLLNIAQYNDKYVSILIKIN